MRRIVARYSHEVDASLWGFFDFYANALLMDERARAAAANDPGVRQIIEYADPTGETAVRHVMSGH